MNILDKTLKGLEGASLRLVWFGGALLILAAVIVTIDVVLRKLFNISMAGADELSGYALGIATMLSLSYALLHRANIRVDALYQHLPAWLRAVLDIVGTALLIAFLGYVSWRGGLLLLDTIDNQSRSITPLRTPLVIPQALWYVGIVLAVLTGVVLIVASLVALIRRDWLTVHRLMGVKALDEQIDEESEAGR